MKDGRPDQAILLRPTGPLDSDSCADLRQQLASAFAIGVTAVAVDLGAVTTVDLAGLGVLVGAARYLRKRGGWLVVVNAGPAIVTSLRINGMEDLLELPATRPLRVVEGSGPGGPRGRSRALTVVPPEGLKLPG